MKLVLTCEHGGNLIPENYQHYFKTHLDVLTTHRGYDLGALNLFKGLRPLAYFSKFSTTSRLLIELNRSLHHPSLFSEFSKTLSKAEKKTLIENYYLVYRGDVKSTINKLINSNEKVVHIAVHSFTPILNAVERHCDIGLLFDSKIKEEKAFCKQLKNQIKKEIPDFNVRYNYPYLGTADGFTSYLRKQFPKNFIGIELEINQKFSLKNHMDSEVKQMLYKTLEHITYS